VLGSAFCPHPRRQHNLPSARLRKRYDNQTDADGSADSDEHACHLDRECCGVTELGVGETPPVRPTIAAQSMRGPFNMSNASPIDVVLASAPRHA